MAVRWAIVKGNKEIFSLGFFYDYQTKEDVEKEQGYKFKLQDKEEIKRVGKYKKEVE